MTDTKKPAKRILAHELLRELNSLTFASSVGKRVRKKKYLMSMLTDLALFGRTTTLDGEVVEVDNAKEWLEVIKTMLNHIDGSASHEPASSGVVFKVYGNIDVDKV